MNSGSKTSFWQLISDPSIDRIEIPRIQRDYAQGREDEKIRYSRGVLLEDMKEALLQGKPLDLNYVYGKIAGKKFIPIDGQQRLTTLLLLHIYAFSREGKARELKTLEKFVYETRETTKRFLRGLAEHLPEYFAAPGAVEIGDFLRDAAWYSTAWDPDPSVCSCLHVLSDIRHLFGDADIADKLLLDCPITFMGLQIENMGNESDLYIKMNSRGLPLTDFEIFKSDLFDLVDGIGKSAHIDASIKNRADTEWMELIWELDEPSADMGASQQKNCDARYLTLLHWLLYNYISVDLDPHPIPEELDKLVKNGGFYNFSNYKHFLSEEKNGGQVLNVAACAAAIGRIDATFTLFEMLRKNNAALLRAVFDRLLKRSVGLRERVLLYAVTKYATVMHGQFSADSFGEWYRIIKNLIYNTEIDKEDKCRTACKTIDGLPDACFADALTYFSAHEEIGFFLGEQAQEESEKARLILSDAAWKDAIVRAEQHAYFAGQIGFMFRLQSGTPSVAEFQRQWALVELLFFDMREKFSENELFRRALLTFGDYSYWAKSSFTFFFERENRYYDWRRMLREPAPFAVFEKFFKALLAESPQSEADVKTNLNRYINDYAYAGNEFLYVLIKIPEVFAYMFETRYKEDESRGRIVIYRKARLSADYAEVYSYALKCLLETRDGWRVTYRYGTGYFEAESSFAFIEKIELPQFSLSFEEKIFFEKGTFHIGGGELKDTSGRAVTRVEDAYNAIKDKLRQHFSLAKP